MSNCRNTNIELLRIISMMLIVLHHLCKYAYLGDTASDVDAVRNIMVLGGKVGVDVFVLISGYFLASGRIKVTSILRVLLEAWFYSLILGLVCAVLAPEVFGAKEFLKSFLPTNNGLPWFVTAYLGMYLVAPWLARLASTLAQAAYEKMLFVGFCVFSIVPTLSGCMFVTNDFSWFCYLFMIAGYIRRFDVSMLKVRWMCIGGGCFLVASVLVGSLIQLKFSGFAEYVTYFANMYTVPTVFVSIGLFCYFKNLEIPTVKWINLAAKGAFGVYLIHENYFMRKLLWPSFDFVFTGGVISEVFAALVVVVVLYAILTAIDLLRLYLLEKPFFLFFQNRFGNWFERCDAILNGSVAVHKNE